MPSGKFIEWPTIGLAVICYGLWLALSALAGQAAGTFWLLLILPVLAAVTTLHSSLCHEALHGHPTRRAWLNEAMVFCAVGIFIPYRRFRALHLRHHANENLTDPYDDPESFYLAWRDWDRLPRAVRLILRFNNTLIGRLIFGPALSLFAFYCDDLKRMKSGKRGVLTAWPVHGLGLVPVIAWLSFVGFPIWLYAAAVAYPAYSLLMLRTFAEHQAHDDPEQRTVIVEASPFFGFLFLNNNLHSAHHDNPAAAWYRLPEIARQEHGSRKYRFRGYGEIARNFAFRAKEPVPHPTWRR